MYTAKNYLINFIGQERLKRELIYYMEGMIKEDRLNILIKGQSGYGKTYLAQIIFSYIFYATNVSFYYYICEKDLDSIEDDITNIFLDEVHLIRDPEFLYPTMDSGKHNIILATNQYYTLKEPLVNRCINLQIEEYSSHNLAEIGSKYFWKNNLEIPDEFCFRIAEIAGSPREVIQLSQRLYIIFKNSSIPATLKDFNKILENTLGIDERGNISQVNSYIELLKSLGGYARLSTIQSCLGLSKEVILYDIEPYLLKRGQISISSKGRKLIDF